jgi:hypothetical protein
LTPDPLTGECVSGTVISMATSQPKVSVRKLRWYQYSLGALMLLVLLVSLGMSWVAVKMKSARQQKEAVEEIEKLGGGVLYDYQIQQPGGLLPGTHPPGPAWLRNLLGEDFFTTVVYASFVYSPVTDAGLEHLKGLTRLRGLAIVEAKATGVGLEPLKGMAQLQTLDFDLTPITDVGLKYLKGLRHLQLLHLGRTKVTDAGLEHLKVLTQLRTLDLWDTQVTDAGLEHLKGLRQLETLSLKRTRVTDGGVKRLQQALPNW